MTWGEPSDKKSFRDGAVAPDPEIQMQALCSFLDSGFALSARPGMTGDWDASTRHAVMAGL